MKIVIVTGMSGAGKSNALNVFEDLDYYCIDNMPPELLASFADLIRNAVPKTDRICFAVDVRSGELFSKFRESVTGLRNSGADVTVVFIDCDDSVLVNRYKETRRRHPLEDVASGNLLDAIAMERKEMSFAREIADIYLDSSRDSTTSFRRRLRSLFEGDDVKMIINVVSFGYMFGVPKDADLVFDVRCLKNPFYVPELRPKNGLDDEVYNYVFDSADAQALYEKIHDLVSFLIPMYVKEGKTRLVIAFGCTGGKHRSVSFARRLSSDLSNEGHDARADHRCVDK